MQITSVRWSVLERTVLIVTTKVEPQPGEEVFKTGCFDDNIGRDVPFVTDDYVGRGTIVRVDMAADGSCAWISFEVPNLSSDNVDLGEMHLSTKLGPGFTGEAEESVSV